MWGSLQQNTAQMLLKQSTLLDDKVGSYYEYKIFVSSILVYQYYLNNFNCKITFGSRY